MNQQDKFFLAGVLLKHSSFIDPATAGTAGALSPLLAGLYTGLDTRDMSATARVTGRSLLEGLLGAGGGAALGGAAGAILGDQGRLRGPGMQAGMRLGGVLGGAAGASHGAYAAAHNVRRKQHKTTEKEPLRTQREKKADQITPGAAGAIGAFSPIVAGIYGGAKDDSVGSGARIGGRSLLEGLLLAMAGGKALGAVGRRMGGRKAMELLGEQPFRHGQTLRIPSRTYSPGEAAEIRKLFPQMGAGVGGAVGGLLGNSLGGAHGAYASARNINEEAPAWERLLQR